MLIVGFFLIGAGALGFAHCLEPELFSWAVAKVIHRPLDVDAVVPPRVILAAAGALYLSGVILIAAHALRHAALRVLMRVAAERADLEALQSASFRALERAEEKLYEADRRREAARQQISRLATEFNAPLTAGERS